MAEYSRTRMPITTSSVFRTFVVSRDSPNLFEAMHRVIVRGVKLPFWPVANCQYRCHQQSSTPDRRSSRLWNRSQEVKAKADRFRFHQSRFSLGIVHVTEGHGIEVPQDQGR